MTNEELIAELGTLRKEMSAAVAEVRASVANANAAAATANAAANQAAAGAAAGVAGARTQQNTEASVDRAMSLLQQQVDSDVDTPEAWKANIKRTYDIHQSLDLESASRNRLHFDHAITQYQSLVSNLNHLNVVQMTNLQNQANIQNSNAIESAKIGSDRMWNVNETDWAAVSMATFVNKVLAEMQKQQESAKA